MHVVVVGAGVAGLLTAHDLAEEGIAVTLLEREDAVARGASAGNGAQLSYSYVAPLAEPSVLGKLPTLLADPASPLRFRLQLDPQQWRWGLQFLAACNIDTARATTAALLRLSFLSRARMPQLVEGLDCDYAVNGKLVVYPDAASLEQARAQMEFQAALGCEQRLLSREQCVEREPALAGYAQHFVGGIWTASEAAADCRLFCERLAQRLVKRGVMMRFGAAVTRIEATGRGVRVHVGRERIAADAIVIANGSAAPALARAVGLSLPIYPLKGYSITVPADGQRLPACSITDTRRKVVFAPLGRGKRRRVRVAGFVELAGHDRSIPPARIDALVAATREVLGLEARGDLAPWCGFRPATPTGLPLLGATKVPGVFLNVGQGALGWTLAAGSARVVVDAIVGRAPPIDVTPFALR
ncbi:MAG TPA: D-amino acid dehydrogenase [Burkholderiaceae bacterium]|jgi:D-amino-acid dehydrogenase|nr:D-amino acid dehydrogenase [Burkholderiaceae bacterium]